MHYVHTSLYNCNTYVHIETTLIIYKSTIILVKKFLIHIIKNNIYIFSLKSSSDSDINSFYILQLSVTVVRI